jgi:hypothetical protein
VSLSLTGLNLGDGNGNAVDWQGLGWNLDGKCTTATSTDVCSLTAGAARQTQDDGNGGIDNSYGDNICAIMEATAGTGACSTKISQAYLQTDASGSGTLSMEFGTQLIALPVKDVYVQTSGAGGVAGGVMPTAGVIAVMQAAAACISSSLCGASAFQSIATQFQQASDILSDGSNAPGSACDAISFGLKFTGSTTVASVPVPASCPCQ